MRIEEVRAVFAHRLRARLLEIEAVALGRLDSLETEGAYAPSPHYLRSAVAAAVDYSIDVFEGGSAVPPPLPPILLAEARLVAREGVGLQALIRRYVAGYALLENFLLEESECSGLAHDPMLRRVFEEQASVIDRVMAS